MKADTPESSENDVINARAAAWLAQRDGGWTARDERSFSEWIAEDPRHAAAFERLNGVWQQLGALKNYRPNTSIHPDPDLLARLPRERLTRTMPRLSWAAPIAAMAAVLLFAFVLLSRNLNFRWRGDGQRYTTPVGGFSRITLADGSVMEMNADTRVQVAFEAEQRRVFLERGEAHFTVARDPSRPFWVESNGFGVRAVGTAFDVHLTPQGIDVLVTAGRVKLVTESHQEIDSAPIVGAGWRAVLNSTQKGVAKLEKMSGPEMRSILAWQSSRLSFVEMPLSEVVEEFNERNDLQLRLEGTELANLAVGGSFAADNVDSFVRLFTSNGDIVADRSTPGVIVLRKAR
ncbi:MAG TPA: FecR domain-containing protein [Opitutaceae bacterium]